MLPFTYIFTYLIRWHLSVLITTVVKLWEWENK